jgi:hypothetical protein
VTSLGSMEGDFEIYHIVRPSDILPIWQPRSGKLLLTQEIYCRQPMALFESSALSTKNCQQGTVLVTLTGHRILEVSDAARKAIPGSKQNSEK